MKSVTEFNSLMRSYLHHPDIFLLQTQTKKHTQKTKLPSPSSHNSAHCTQRAIVPHPSSLKEKNDDGARFMFPVCGLWNSLEDSVCSVSSGVWLMGQTGGLRLQCLLCVTRGTDERAPSAVSPVCGCGTDERTPSAASPEHTTLLVLLRNGIAFKRETQNKCQPASTVFLKLRGLCSEPNLKPCSAKAHFSCH